MKKRLLACIVMVTAPVWASQEKELVGIYELDRQGRTPLCAAIIKKNLCAVLRLCEKGASPAFKSQDPECCSCSPFHYIARLYQLEDELEKNIIDALYQTLKKQQLSLCIEDAEGKTPYYYAIEEQNIPVLSYFIAKEPEIEYVDFLREYTPAHALVEKNAALLLEEANLATWFLDKKYLEKKEKEWEYTPLYLACVMRSPLANPLLENGASIDVLDKTELPLLCFLIDSFQNDLFSSIVLNLKPNNLEQALLLKDKKGDCASHYAARKNIEALKVLQRLDFFDKLLSEKNNALQKPFDQEEAKQKLSAYLLGALTLANKCFNDFSTWEIANLLGNINGKVIGNIKFASERQSTIVMGSSRIVRGGSRSGSPMQRSPVQNRQLK